MQKALYTPALPAAITYSVPARKVSLRAPSGIHSSH